MIKRQSSWDKYEAVILLEGLLSSMKGELTRSDAIRKVSRDLRKIALHRGMKVNRAYRNTNGISFQMKSMESAYLGRTAFKPATKLFADVVGLYHESYDEYQKLLKEARAMISDGEIAEDRSTIAHERSDQILPDIEKAEAESPINAYTKTKQDERLLQKHPAVYNQIYTALKTSPKGQRFTIQEICESIRHTACPAVIEEILDNVSWASNIGDYYSFSEDASVIATNTFPNSRRFFCCYLSKTLNMAEATCRSYASSINSCEAFAREHQLASWQIYTTDKQTAQKTIQLLLSNAEFRSYNARQHNRFSAAIQKFLRFIGSDLTWDASAKDNLEPAETYRNEVYEEILSKYFKKGFRMDSPLEIRKFKRYYTETHDKEITDSDDDISQKIKQLCIIYKGKAFFPDSMLSEELKDELLNYIENAFAKGKTAIYYQAIFSKFSDAFLNYHIHDADMLKLYLTFIGNGRFFIRRNFISQKADINTDPLSEVRSFLQDYGRPATYDEIFAALPHLPQSKIKSVLAGNVEFIRNRNSEYFHESIVHLSDEELAGIVGIIQRTIDEKDFISGNELYDAIREKYPYIIDENHALSKYGFRDVLKAKLGNQFSFKGNIISRPGQELSMADVFANYARNHDDFTLSELQKLADNLDTIIYFDEVYENSLRISRDQFVTKTSAQFPIKDMDEALDRICVGKYISLKEVTNFGVFPYAGFSWNSFLLEHYVAGYSQKYMLLHSSFNGTKCVGAIVKRSAGLDCFDDLIVDLLVNNQIEMKKDTVLQFLSDKGYLARRRYSEIESLIIKANAQRKDTD